jgi:aldehyde:ferredoxin oxidoreductase
VNLSNGETSVQYLDDVWYRTYLGGWGLVAYVLLTETPADCDPLGPDNKLIVAAGLLTGAPLAGSGRNAIGAKSPLTGAFGESDVGGFFGAELRHAGWDGIIVEGAAERPVYLWIQDERVEIREARHLWGRTTGEAEGLIQDELGDQRVRVCQIGPAGEKLGLLSAIANDISHYAGRCGLGAVMGAKKLRAIAVRGSGKPELADPETIKRWTRWQAEQIKMGTGAARILRQYGTAGLLMTIQAPGGLPTRNFTSGYFEGAERIEGEHLAATILKGGDTCYACPIRCKRVVETHDQWGVDPTYGGPEYETLAALGSNCGIDDLPAICKGNELCNAYGLDTIGVGAVIAWAMECFERGLLTPADTDGLDLRFGNAPAMVQLVERIARREGFGGLLAQGAYRAAQAVGRGSERYVMHVKKQEVPMHDPRIKHGLDIAYAVSPTGAEHNHGFHDVRFETPAGIAGVRALGIHRPIPFADLSPAKVRLLRRWLCQRGFQNSVGLCTSMNFSVSVQRELVEAATGWDFSLFELEEVGERVWDMARVFNYRCGLRATDDVPPARFSEPIQGGPNAGVFVPPDALADALRLFYDMMGWDHVTGSPLPWKLHELGLSWLVE